MRRIGTLKLKQMYEPTIEDIIDAIVTLDKDLTKRTDNQAYWIDTIEDSLDKLEKRISELERAS